MTNALLRFVCTDSHQPWLPSHKGKNLQLENNLRLKSVAASGDAGTSTERVKLVTL